MVRTGTDAPDFTLPGLDGLQYSLHQARSAGPVLLVFWQAGCGACRMVAPYLNRLQDTYENVGWTFWTVAQDAVGRAQEFVEKEQFRPTVLVDGPQLAVSDLYDPPSTPTMYLVEPGEGVTFEADGFDKEVLNDLSRRIAAYTGSEYRQIAPADDGNPAYRPG